MARKQVLGKERIAQAALELFFEKGYDDTSMRDVANRAGCSTGLAYNYFSNKDELFSSALELFFDNYRERLEHIASNALRNPFQSLLSFFYFMVDSTLEFREKYADKLHWVVRWAIRERTLGVIEPYLYRIISVLVDFGATPPLSLEMTNMVLSHGIGSVILHADFIDDEDKKIEIRKACNLIMGLHPSSADIMFPLKAIPGDLEKVLKLKGKNHEIDLAYKDRINQCFEDGILLIKHEDEVVGYIVYDLKKNVIEDIVVDDRYTYSSIALRLLVTASASYGVGDEVEFSAVSHDDNYLNFIARYGTIKPDGKVVLIVPTDVRELIKK